MDAKEPKNPLYRDEQALEVIERLSRSDRKPRNARELKQVCCICGAVFYGFGNDPAPVKEEGRCCNACNWEHVIPARKEAKAV